ncbi:MAG: serine/threonine-protein kinase, partial [Myxococcota bacterium]
MNPRRYELRGLLGEGAFGSVWLAEATAGGLRKPVAIKVLKPDAAAQPGVVGRLRDEARLLALIRHRAIVRVDELVELEGGWSVVMEYVEGCDVAALVRRGPVPARAACAIAAEVANALHAAFTARGPDGQALRLVHRDIKPGNVRLTALGDVKLLDFGVARADFSAREAATSGTAYGTLPYMAPERFEGRDSQAGDVYALGVTLFEMLAGARPGTTPGDPDRQPPGRALAHAWSAIAETSPALASLVARMLAPDPARRPTPREVARTLGDLAPTLPGEALEDWAAEVVPPLCEPRRAGEPTTVTVGASGTVPLDAVRASGAALVAGAGVAA